MLSCPRSSPFLRLESPSHRTLSDKGKAESFRFSTDPELVGKVTDICGLYLGTYEDISANAIVLCVGEKSQSHALDRTVPILPMQEGRIERRSHDYYRHHDPVRRAGDPTCQVVAALEPKHRHQEFLAFLRQIERAYLTTSMRSASRSYCTW